MKILSTVVFLSILWNVYSQNTLNFNITVLQSGTSFSDYYSDVQLLSDGSFIACGTSAGSVYASNNASSNDFVVAKYRPDLTVYQGIQFGTSGYDSCNSLAVDESTGIIFTVSSVDSTPALQAFNSSTLLQKWAVYGIYQDTYTHVALDLANNRVVVVGVSQTGGSNWAPAVQVYDTNGGYLWNYTFPNSGYTFYVQNIAWDATVDSAGNIYACGRSINSSVNGTQEDGWYAKLFVGGSLSWFKKLASNQFDELTSVDMNPSTNTLYVSGYSYGRFQSDGTPTNETGNPRGVIMSVSPIDGSINWIYNQTTYSSNTNCSYSSLKYYATDSLIYTVGITSLGDFPPYNYSGGGNVDWFIEIFTTSGLQIKFLNVSGSNAQDVAYIINLDSNGNFVAAGYTKGSWASSLAGQSDFALMHGTALASGSSTGSSTSTSTTDGTTGSPGGSQSSNAGSGSSAGAIAGGVVAGVVVAVAIIVAVVLLLRKKKKNNPMKIQSEENTQKATVMTPTTTATTNSSSVQVFNSPGSQTTYTSSQDNKNVYGNATIVPPPKTSYSSVGSEYSKSNASFSGGSGSAIAVRKDSKDDWVIPFESLTIDKKIGAGAFGEVFRGTWRGVDVAIKKMIVEEGVELNLKIQDFFAEAEVMKKIKPHYNITALYGVCVQPLCIITEYVANGSLYNWLMSSKHMDDELAFNIIKGTAAGMLHLHSQGVIHRDLAARNILLDKTLTPKVSDFGMSRVALDNKTNRTANDIGPIKWMAPEAMSDRLYNTKTDVWSFGVVIYEVLTRKTPYEGFNLMEVATGILSGKISLVPSLRDPQKMYPPQLVDLAEECLQRDPKLRPQFEQILNKMK